MSERRELLIGCGSEHTKRLCHPDHRTWSGLITLDFNADHKPDVVHDLESLPLPFEDDSLDEIHAYEVLEHTGAQGDWRFFFAQWSDFWRVLKPGGHFFGTCPAWNSMWAWGDPSHRRVINEGSLVFLNQEEYRKQVGKTPMSDFRFCYKADFDVVHLNVTEGSFQFGVRAVKPSRIMTVQEAS